VFNEGIIPNANNIDINSGQLYLAARDITEHKTTLFYCRSGMRSAKHM
jgi:rhodanese-related sulfurtransferase